MHAEMMGEWTHEGERLGCGFSIGMLDHTADGADHGHDAAPRAQSQSCVSLRRVIIAAVRLLTCARMLAGRGDYASGISTNYERSFFRALSSRLGLEPRLILLPGAVGSLVVLTDHLCWFYS